MLWVLQGVPLTQREGSSPTEPPVIWLLTSLLPHHYSHSPPAESLLPQGLCSSGSLRLKSSFPYYLLGTFPLGLSLVQVSLPQAGFLLRAPPSPPSPYGLTADTFGHLFFGGMLYSSGIEAPRGQT